MKNNSVGVSGIYLSDFCGVNSFRLQRRLSGDKAAAAHGGKELSFLFIRDTPNQGGERGMRMLNNFFRNKDAILPVPVFSSCHFL